MRGHPYRLTLTPSRLHPVDARYVAQSGEMPRERPTAILGERQPRARPLADEPLVDLDVAGLLEGAHLLRQHRIADLDVVPHKAELSLRSRSQQGHDREANRMAKKVVQLVAWVAHRRPNSHAP